MDELVKGVAVGAGLGVIAAVFGTLLAQMAKIDGWGVTLAVWAGAVIFTGLIVGGVFAVTWGLS